MDDGSKLKSEIDAAKRVGRGCHFTPNTPSPVYREEFDEFIEKLARNCKYSISQEDSNKFPNRAA